MNRTRNRRRRSNFRFPPATNSEFNATLTTPKSPTVEDIGRHKRVRFAVSEKDSPRSCRLEDSYIPPGREKKVTTYNDPKTSEYAFFMKLKKDVGIKFHSRPPQKDASPLKKPEPTDYSRERTGDVRVGSKGFNTSRTIEEMATDKTDSFCSPSFGDWNKSDLYSVSSIQKNSQGCGNTIKTQGNPNVHGGIFSRKRQKLRQCVADTLFPDTEKSSLKGHDIVSMLLSRLSPMSIEENEFEDPNPRKEVNATGYDLPDSRDSDGLYNEHDQIPVRKLFEQSSSSYFGDHLLSPMSVISDERITAHTAFPTSRYHNFQPPYSITEPEYEFGMTPCFSAKRDLNLGFQSNGVMNSTGYGLLDSQELDIRFKEHHPIPEMKLLEFEPYSCIRDHLLSPIILSSNESVFPKLDFPTSRSHEFQPLYSITEPECEFGGISSFRAKSDVTIKLLSNEQEHDTFTLDHFRELGKLKRDPIPLLLERDFGCPTDDKNLLVAYKYAKPDVVPALLSASGNDEEHMLKNILGECHLCPSSFLFDKPHGINSISDSGLLRCQEFRFGNNVHEDEDDLENFNHAVLPLSHNNQHWIRTAYNDYAHCHPDSEAWLSSSLNFITGQRCLSLTGSGSDYRGSGSSTLRLPQRENMASLFRVKDDFEPEMDGGNREEFLYHFRKGLIEICNSSFLNMSMQKENGCPLPLDGNDDINELEETHNMLIL